MFEFQKDHCEFVYHYTKPEIAIDFILKDRRLRLSKLTSTNDPKESKNCFFIPGTNERRNLDRYTPDKLSKMLNKHIKDETSLLCLSKDQPLSGNHMVDLNLRGFCRPRMWAQYASNHTGVCLVFRFETLSKLFYEQHSEKTYASDNVAYRNRNISEIQMDPAFIVNIDYLEDKGMHAYAYAHIQKYMKRIYFEKGTDWEHESEFRFCVFDTKQTIFINYKNALAGLVFGESCNDKDIASMIEMTQGCSLSYLKLRWRNCAPWIEHIGRHQFE